MELGICSSDDTQDVEYATVKQRAVDQDGKLIGVSHYLPNLDTRQYEVKFHISRLLTLFLPISHYYTSQ